MAQHGIPVHNLPLLREWRGLTQRQLAQAIPISPCALWLWEEGKSNPTPRNLTRLARALGVSERLLRVEHPKTALTLARLWDRRPVTAGGILRWERLILRLGGARPYVY